MPAFGSSFKKQEKQQEPLLGSAWVNQRKSQRGEFQVISLRLNFEELDKFVSELREKGEDLEKGIPLELTEVREKKNENSPDLVCRKPFKMRQG
jgi:hypothetical protein